MNKVFLGVILVFFAGSAFAIDANTTELNQSELDDLNVSAFNSSNLQCQIDSSFGVQFFDGNYYIGYSCLNVFKTDINSYSVIRHNNHLTVSDNDINNCLSSHTQFFCVNQILNLFLGQVEEFIQVIRENILSHQTGNPNKNIVEALEELDLFE